MDRAGLRKGDHPRTALYPGIVFNQGKTISIPVERLGVQLVVQVQVPYLPLQDDPRALHWFLSR